jgi:hypothetical protein
MQQRLMSEKPFAIGRAEKPEKEYPGRFPIEQIVFSERYGDAWRRGR